MMVYVPFDPRNQYTDVGKTDNFETHCIKIVSYSKFILLSKALFLPCIDK